MNTVHPCHFIRLLSVCIVDKALVDIGAWVLIPKFEKASLIYSVCYPRHFAYNLILYGSQSRCHSHLIDDQMKVPKD